MNFPLRQIETEIKKLETFVYLKYSLISITLLLNKRFLIFSIYMFNTE